jgi:hypothetical protein
MDHAGPKPHRCAARGKAGHQSRTDSSAVAEIERALADGQSLKSIREWLEEEGVTVTRATLSSYKRRFRRREEANRKTAVLEAFLRQTGAALQTQGLAQEASPEPAREAGEPVRDPFAQARRALEKTFDIRTIHGDGDPTGRNLV